MLQKLKKMPRYAAKAIQQANISDVFQLLTHVKMKHWLIALAAYVDKRSASVEMKHQLGMQDIHLLLNILPYRRKRLENNFFLWEHGNKRFCATHLQFIGLYLEYFSGQFDKIYAFDWKDKVVLDVGGFIGDSALYILEKGAKQVIIYEPLPENTFALHYNLQAYKEKIQVHQKAVAQQEGMLTLSSSLPIGSLGFGMEKGEYQIQCQGISLSQMLKQHQVDVVKLDCEGGEAHLVDLSVDELRSIPYWIVETHNHEIYRNVLNKFNTCGFAKIQDVAVTPCVNLLHFQKK
jgi:FkbM family methyltransferase